MNPLLHAFYNYIFSPVPKMMFPRKENGDFPMATPPTSPQKFSPSVTSSPSILSATSLVKTQPLPPHLTPTTPAKNASNTKDNALTPKRRSYMEAVSNSQLNMNP